jgi:hypothetical protein
LGIVPGEPNERVRVVERTVWSRFGVQLVVAVAALLLDHEPARAEEGGVVSYHCRSASVPRQTWTFSVDYDRHTVVIEAPVNWTWITRQYVLFLHSAFVNGRHYLTQSYTLDRTTGAFEVCDYASGPDQRSPCDATFLCRPYDVSPAHLPEAVLGWSR